MKTLQLLRALRESCREHAEEFSPENRQLGRTLTESSAAAVRNLERVLDAWIKAEDESEIFLHHSRPPEPWAAPLARRVAGPDFEEDIID